MAWTNPDGVVIGDPKKGQVRVEPWNRKTRRKLERVARRKGRRKRRGGG